MAKSSFDEKIIIGRRYHAYVQTFLNQSPESLMDWTTHRISKTSGISRTFSAWNIVATRSRKDRRHILNNVMP